MDFLAIPLWLDVLAIGFGAMAGGLAARRHGFDIVGVMFLAVIGGLGGAILRDLLLQVPIRALHSPWLLPATIMGGLLVTPLLSALGTRYRREFGFVVIDAVSLAMYSLIGANKAHLMGLPFVSSVFVGVLAGVGGAVIRDVLVNEVPENFRPGSFYALAAIPGCVGYLLLNMTPFPAAISALTCGLLIFGLRVSSWWFKWHSAPVARL